jgi:hypothetical protein
MPLKKVPMVPAAIARMIVARSGAARALLPEGWYLKRSTKLVAMRWTLLFKRC